MLYVPVPNKVPPERLRANPAPPGQQPSLRPTRIRPGANFHSSNWLPVPPGGLSSTSLLYAVQRSGKRPTRPQCGPRLACPSHADFGARRESLLLLARLGDAPPSELWIPPWLFDMHLHRKDRLEAYSEPPFPPQSHPTGVACWAWGRRGLSKDGVLDFSHLET